MSSQKTLKLTLPVEFLDLCEEYHTDPETVLRGFIADLCGIRNRASDPRPDGLCSTAVMSARWPGPTSSTAATGSSRSRPVSKQRPSRDEGIQSLQEGFFGKDRDLQEADPIEPTPMVVAIENIKEYDHNPRRERNEAYDRIKGSIRQRGFTGALPITRRPGEAEYMVAEGGNTVLHILKEICAETHDPRFYSVHCLFELWKSESETLIAHLVENDARGELIFIDRARAVHELRELLEQETAGAPRSIRQLATLLQERGYSIDHTMIIRLHYTVETLLPVIPMALRAGLGRDEVQQIRKLESILVTFLEDRQRDTAVIEGARRWFLDCLGRHDGEYFSLDPARQEIEAQVTELCGETIAKVRADFGLIEQTGKPGTLTPRWGWIERRQTANHASVHYRLTPAFAETVEMACEEVSAILRQCIPLGTTSNELRADTAHRLGPTGRAERRMGPRLQAPGTMALRGRATAAVRPSRPSS